MILNALALSSAALVLAACLDRTPAPTPGSQSGAVSASAPAGSAAAQS